ncbi:MAG: single-stranded DNA-binding protein [Patescibacteria group bacterium]|nr:single-stranded DNA-binding protein [Patescibacteria group bacterium]MDE1944301.1 single-stranded DNA-binding protein [Patescibacteria group bacterium]MDE1944788.1 single-stranded DNA-binding protein [Patescibacteria group bacterium]MDE2057241.1 single-stranded DNA-binding protein [Patescibacteria group bacterium]
MYLNKAFLYGNLTRDPEMRALPSGGQVASFSIATNRVYKDRDGAKQEATEFHNCVAFGRSAELIAQYMKKGRPLFVEGRIQTRSWDDKETGKKNYRTEIVVDNFQFGDGGQGRGGEGGGYQAAPARESAPAAPKEDAGEIQYPDEEINPEDIPF